MLEDFEYGSLHPSLGSPRLELDWRPLTVSNRERPLLLFGRRLTTQAKEDRFSLQADTKSDAGLRLVSDVSHGRSQHFRQCISQTTAMNIVAECGLRRPNE
jgi:hypothetical protein